MTKVILTTSDPVTILLFPPEESLDMYGPDFVEEDGVDVPDELIKRFTENREEFYKIQEELRKYYE